MRRWIATGVLAVASALAWLFVAGLAYYGCGEEETLRDGTTFERFCHDESTIGQSTVITAFTVALILVCLAPLVPGRRLAGWRRLAVIAVVWMVLVGGTALLPQILDR